MASGGDKNWGIDGVGVHTRLIIMMHRDQGPVGDDTGNAHSLRVSGGWGWTGDEILYSSGVEELDIGERENTREEG